jgi:viologen exporter family transport system ATP-binding protein
VKRIRIVVPTSGRVRTCGLDPVPERRCLARQVGVVFGQRSQLWWDLPLRDAFRIPAAIHRIPAAEADPRIAELVAELELSHLLDTRSPRPARRESPGPGERFGPGERRMGS